jgi:hypothetical protein
MKKVFRVISINILLCLAVFFIAEIFCYAMGYNKKYVASTYVSHERFAKSRMKEFPRYYYVEDLKKGFDIAPNHKAQMYLKDIKSDIDISSNFLGCFDRNKTYQDGYILSVGDSFAWGFNQYKDKYDVILQDILGVDVAKCGVSGAGTFFAKDKAQEVIKKIGKRPSVIVSTVYENDVLDDYFYPKEYVIKGYKADAIEYNFIVNRARRISKQDALEKYNKIVSGEFFRRKKISFENIGKFFMANSVIVNSFANAFASLSDEYQYVEPFRDYEYSYNYVNHPTTKANQRAILELQKLAKENDAKLILVLCPTFWITNSQNSDYFADFKRFLKKHSIEYVSIVPEISKTDNPKRYFWSGNWHFSPEGTKLVAKKLKDNIEKEIKKEALK